MALIALLRACRESNAASLYAPALRSVLGQQVAPFASTEVVVKKTDWSAVKLPELTVHDIPTTVEGGQAYGNDLRGASGLGLGDGIKNHTDKWLSGNHKSPMQYIKEAEPILVEGPVVASHGAEDPALGCPVEYINLKGSSKEHPAVCKYTGNRYYSLPHTWNHH